MKPWRTNGSLLAVVSLALGSLGFPNAQAAVQLGLGSAVANLERRASVPLVLENDTPVVAFQVDVIADPPLAGFQVPVTAGMAGGHFVDGAEVGRGVYRIIVYSLFNQPLQSGAILNLQCAVDSGFGGDSVLLAMTNAIAASGAATAVSDVRTTPGVIRLGAPSVVRIRSVSLGAGVLRLQVTGLSSGRVTLEQGSVLGSWTAAETMSVSGGEALFNLPVQPADRTRFFRVRAD